LRLAVSNIIWKKGKDNFADFLKTLTENNIYNVELALSCIWEEPASCRESDIAWLKNLLEKYGVNISALHSLTYTRADLEIFGLPAKKNELIEYIKRYVELARLLGTENIVYGSPKSRKIHGLSKAECDEVFLGFLEKTDRFCTGLNFNIEPLPASFCEYLNTYTEAVNLLKSNNFKNVFIQLDLKAIFDSDSYNLNFFIENKQYFRHLQVSDLDFGPPGHKDIINHNLVKDLLKAIGYQGFISMEAVSKSTGSPNFDNYLGEFSEIYGRND
jgi:sugar phosphate isomerase/epimerase